MYICTEVYVGYKKAIFRIMMVHLNWCLKIASIYVLRHIYNLAKFSVHNVAVFGKTVTLYKLPYLQFACS